MAHTDAKDCKRAVIQLDLENNIIAEFESVKQAARQFGGAAKYSSSIYAACTITKKNKILSMGRGRYKKEKSNIAYGYKWKFKEL